MTESTIPNDVGDPVSIPTPPSSPVPPVTVRPGVEQAATFAALMAKSRRVGEFKVPMPGSDEVLVITAQAIGFVEYDNLVDACPPTEKERVDGARFNLEKFGPRLLAACLTSPQLTTDEAVALWKNPNWAGGEVIDLFRKVNELCQRGLDVPFTAPG